MIGPFTPLRALATTVRAFRDDIAPGREPNEERTATLQSQVKQLAATWFFALAALVCASCAPLYTAYALDRADLLGAIELHGGLVVGLGLLAWALLRLSVFSGWSPYAH